MNLKRSIIILSAVLVALVLFAGLGPVLGVPQSTAQAVNSIGNPVLPQLPMPAGTLTTPTTATPMVSAGYLHTVGLKSDGTAVAMGGTRSGQCDVSGWSGIVRVSAGWYHTVGLKSDGTAVAVGYNDYGQCSVSGWSDIIQVSAGRFHTVGLKSDGTVVAVGDNAYDRCNVSGWSGIVQVATGEYHTVGLKSDGTVVAVGDNGSGQCNVSGWSGMVQVAAGGYHTVCLKSDGTVVAVGDNAYDRCNVSGWSGIVQVSAGGIHTVGLKSDGTVVAVGDNGSGQCNVSGWSGMVQVAAGGYHTVCLKSDGTVVAMGLNQFGQCEVTEWSGIVQVSAGYRRTVGLKSDGTVVAVGSNGYGQCNVSGWSGMVQVSAGVAHTVGLKSDGTAVAVGDNYNGQCNVSGWSGMVQVSAGVAHTVGLKSDGTVVAVGNNAYGRCNVSGWSGIVQVAAGVWHTVGLKSDGTVVAVGDNAYGRCNVSGWSGIVQVAAGEYHTVGLKSDGTVVAVGANWYGQCNVSGWSGMVQVAAGEYHTVGLKSDGTVVAVGYDRYGGCEVSGWSGIVQVAAGEYHTVGLKSDGTAVAAPPGLDTWDLDGGGTTFDPVGSAANIQLVCSLADYYQKLSTYSDTASADAEKLHDPRLSNEEKQALYEKVAKAFPVLSAGAESIQSFYSYLRNLIIDGKTVIFEKRPDGTLMTEDGESTLLDFNLPVDRITLSAQPAQFQCLFAVDSGTNHFTITLEPYTDFLEVGFRLNAALDTQLIDANAELSLFVGPVFPAGIGVGISGRLTLQTANHVIVLTLSDPLSTHDMSASAGISVGLGLSAHAGTGGGAKLDVGVFAEGKPIEITGANLDVLSTALGDAGGRIEGGEAIVALERSLNVLEGVSTVIGSDVAVGAEIALEGKLGLGLGGQIGAGAEVSIDAMGGVSAGVSMPLGTFAQLMVAQSQIPEFILCSQAIASELASIESAWDVILKTPALAKAYWTACNRAKEIKAEIQADALDEIKCSRSVGAGISGSVTGGPIGLEISGQRELEFETDLKTLIDIITFHWGDAWDEGYAGVSLSNNLGVSLKFGAGRKVTGKFGFSKDIVGIEIYGKGHADAPTLGFSMLSLAGSSDLSAHVLSDSGEDTDGDGLYNSLVVNLELGVTSPDDYRVGGMLFKDSTCVGAADFAGYLNSGTHTLTLSFDGLDLRNQGVDGPYQFGLVIGRAGAADTLLEDLSLYETSAYSYTDFEESYLSVLGFDTEGSDSNGNGLYDILQVNTTVNSTASGTITATGILHGEGLSIGSQAVYVLSPGTSTLSLAFDGKEIRTFCPGSYQAIVSVAGEDGVMLGTGEIDVTIPCSSFEIEKAALSGTYTDSAVDSDGNGKYDYLKLGVGVEVVQSGTYTVDAYLSGTQSAFYTASSAYLPAGQHTVDLKVDGTLIRGTLQDQPYALTNVRLYQSGTLCGTSLYPYDTGSYSYADFEGPVANLTDQYSDGGVDENGDSVYDYLNIDVGLEVSETGSYKVSGYLKCGEGYVYAEESAILIPGARTVTLSFDGDSIAARGYSGTYQLERVGLIQNDEYIGYMSGVYETAFYDFADFCAEATVDISLALQGSSRPDPSGWQIPVTVKFFEPGSDPFTELAVYEFNPTTSKDGDAAVCEVTGVVPGTYDITVVSEHTLMNVKRNVIVSAPSTAVDMGTLLEGDWNGNLTIDWEDLGTVLLTYDKCEGGEGFDPAADFNRNGCIDWEDLGLVLINYDKASPVEVG